ncbi:hypothetical protein GQ54DRAFT_258570 [Martensiomyces pterosporus]|nr:hypothetical protein GQ54DRAFT_258570 [Martensiomyces pterosporus]
MSTTPGIEALWAGTPFKPVFEQKMHPVLALVFASVGLVYAGKFSVTRRDLSREILFAVISSVALGLATVLGVQALGLYL